MSGDYKDLYETTAAELREGARESRIKVQVDSRQREGFRSEIAIRDFTLVIDQPKGFGGANQGPKPSEVLLASLAACQEITWRLYADALGVPVDGIRVELSGIQDLRGFLAVDETVRPGFQGITGTVTIDSPASDADLERLRAVVDGHCPVLDDLRAPVSVELTLARGS